MQTFDVFVLICILSGNKKFLVNHQQTLLAALSVVCNSIYCLFVQLQCLLRIKVVILRDRYNHLWHQEIINPLALAEKYRFVEFVSSQMVASFSVMVHALACTMLLVLATCHMMDHTSVKSATQVNWTLIFILSVFMFQLWSTYLYFFVFSHEMNKACDLALASFVMTD